MSESPLSGSAALFHVEHCGESAQETQRQKVVGYFDFDAGTSHDLDRYVQLLRDWQLRMNLVSKSTLANIWQRHFADSAQLVTLANASPASVWLDLGSGAGFPGLILARCSVGEFHLVEATRKKAEFLAAAVATLGVCNRVTIHNERIEALRPFDADYITARACAPLSRLFAWGLPFARNATWLLLKGRLVDLEIEAAREHFSFDYQRVASVTEPSATIIIARNVRRLRA